MKCPNCQYENPESSNFCGKCRAKLILVCTQCGKAVEFSGAGDLNSLMKRIHQETGYKIDSHLLQLQGVCPDCQKDMQDDEN